MPCPELGTRFHDAEVDAEANSEEESQMRAKALLVIGFAAGYVFGARAGRARYEQIADLAGRTWRSPQARDAREAAAAKMAETAPRVQRALADAGASATNAVQDKLSGATSGQPG